MTDKNAIPVADVLANPGHPLHQEVTDVIEKLKAGTISMCACMGPQFGEPMCPCAMRNAGIPPSAARLAAEAESQARLQAWSNAHAGGLDH